MMTGSSKKIHIYDLETQKSIFHQKVFFSFLKVYRELEFGQSNFIILKPFFNEKFNNLFFSINEKHDCVLWDLRIKKQLNFCSLFGNKTTNNLILFDNYNEYSQFISGCDNGIIKVKTNIFKK